MGISKFVYHINKEHIISISEAKEPLQGHEKMFTTICREVYNDSNFRPDQRIVIEALDYSSLGAISTLEFVIEALDMLKPRAIHIFFEFGPDFYPGQLIHSTLEKYFQKRGVFFEYSYKDNIPDFDAYRGR